MSENPNKLTIAILDSGMPLEDPNFKKYRIQSFDLTGEGPNDLNGHGTSVAAIALGFPNWYNPSSRHVLNIKILDKDLKTDEITLLKGLYVAAENGACVINLSAAVWISKETAEPIVRKLLQWSRRYPLVTLVLAAGNYEFDLDEQAGAKILFPQQAKMFAATIDIEKLHEDILADAIYVANRGGFSQANDMLVSLISELPNKTLEERVFRLRRGLLFTEFAYECQRKEDTKRFQAFSKKAHESLTGILDFRDLMIAAEKRK